MHNKPHYPYEPIASLKSLSAALGISQINLQTLTEKSNSYYYLTKELVKPDGSIRQTYDVKHELKHVHEKISNVLFRKVQYPDYLHGSLKGKDYLSNCKQHTGKKFIISEDATNFFPSISKKIVYEVWTQFFGFPNDIADCLAELTTFNGALVQGAKPSSYISNLVLWEREADLVRNFKNLGYGYTRYIDDITVSSSRHLSKKEQSSIISQIYGMLETINVKPNRKKHQAMPNGKCQNVHRVNVNTSRPTLPKQKRANIKAAVFSCQQAYVTEAQSLEYEKLFNKTMGRVNNMVRMHPNKGQKLKQKLNLIKPISRN